MKIAKIMGIGLYLLASPILACDLEEMKEESKKGGFSTLASRGINGAELGRQVEDYITWMNSSSSTNPHIIKREEIDEEGTLDFLPHERMAEPKYRSAEKFYELCKKLEAKKGEKFQQFLQSAKGIYESTQDEREKAALFMLVEGVAEELFFTKIYNPQASSQKRKAGGSTNSSL